MSSQPVDQLLKSILNAGAPTQANLEKLLGVTFKPQAGQQNPHWKFYTFELSGGPFKGGELRLSTSGDRALQSLLPRDEQPLKESDVDLKQWGQAINIDINPQIPPEGTDAYTYVANGPRLSF